MWPLQRLPKPMQLNRICTLTKLPKRINKYEFNSYKNSCLTKPFKIWQRGRNQNLISFGPMAGVMLED